MTALCTLVNGSPATSIPVDDRGLAYGDGLFETIAFKAGRVLALELHLKRLFRDAPRLGVKLDSSMAVYRSELVTLAERYPLAVAKLMVTAGSGGRGYRSPAEPQPRRIVSVHEWPQTPDSNAEQGLQAIICKHPLSANPGLAGIKHLNRLDQVIASNELQAKTDFEGLMLNGAGDIIEGTRSNIFVVVKNRLLTPDLSHCGVAGVVREAIIERSASLGIKLEVGTLSDAMLGEADEVFMTNAIIGVCSLARIKSANGLIKFKHNKLATSLREMLQQDGIIP